MTDRPDVAYLKLVLAGLYTRILREEAAPLYAAIGLPPDFPDGWDFGASPSPPPPGEAVALAEGRTHGRDAQHWAAGRSDPYG